MKLLTYSQKERKEAKERKTTTTTLHTKSNSFLSSLVGPPHHLSMVQSSPLYPEKMKTVLRFS